MLADMGAGAGTATYDWFEKMFDDSRDMNIRFTAIGVTTNDPGAVLSVLRWAKHLQQQVDYLIVLNETSETDRTFEYWNDNPLVQKLPMPSSQSSCVPMSGSPSFKASFGIRNSHLKT